MNPIPPISLSFFSECSFSVNLVFSLLCLHALFVLSQWGKSICLWYYVLVWYDYFYSLLIILIIWFLGFVSCISSWRICVDLLNCPLWLFDDLFLFSTFLLVLIYLDLALLRSTNPLFLDSSLLAFLGFFSIESSPIPNLSALPLGKPPLPSNHIQLDSRPHVLAYSLLTLTPSLFILPHS